MAFVVDVSPQEMVDDGPKDEGQAMVEAMGT